MNEFTLEFDTPADGWLGVTLRSALGQQNLDVSDVPACSLAMLAEAAYGMSLGDDARRVSWFLEPDEIVWTLVRDDDAIIIESNGEELVRGQSTSILRTIWRALRRLESDPCWSQQPSGRVWSWEFPSRTVKSLGNSLKR